MTSNSTQLEASKVTYQQTYLDILKRTKAKCIEREISA